MKQYAVKISPQGQVTVPKALRDKLKVREGSRIMLSLEQSDTLVLSVGLPIERYFGTLGKELTHGQDAAKMLHKARSKDTEHREKLV